MSSNCIDQDSEGVRRLDLLRDPRQSWMTYPIISVSAALIRHLHTPNSILSGSFSLRIDMDIVINEERDGFEYIEANYLFIYELKKNHKKF